MARRTSFRDAGLVRVGLLVACALGAVGVVVSSLRGSMTSPANAVAAVTLTEFEFARPPDAEPGASFNVIAVSANGRYVLYEFGLPSGANGSPGRTLYRRDLTTGEDRVLGVNQYTFPVMSSDGRYVVFTAPSNGITLWDSESADSPQLLASGAYPSMSDDARFIGYYSAERATIVVKDRLLGQEVPLKNFGGGTPRVSGDGSLISLGQCCRSGVSQFSSATGELVRSIDTPFDVIVLDVSYSGRYIVGFSGGTVEQVGYFWADMETGRYERIPRTADGSCGGPFEHSIDLADDGTWAVLLTNGMYGTGLGPNSDGSFDAHGAYFVSIGASDVTVTSASGLRVPSRVPSNNCGTLAATGDGTVVLFASQYGADWRPTPPDGCPECTTYTTIDGASGASGPSASGPSGPGIDDTWPPPPDPEDSSTTSSLEPSSTAATSTTMIETPTTVGGDDSTTTSTMVPAAFAGLRGPTASPARWFASAASFSHILIAKRGSGGGSGTSSSTSSTSSTPSTSTVAVVPPGAPTSVTAQANGGSVSVGWLAPASTGGAAIQEYYVKSSPGGRSCRTSTLGCAVTGLVVGQPYVFKVWARNKKGWGAPSVPSGEVTLLRACCTAIPGNAMVSVQWPGTAWPEVVAVTGFELQRSSDDGKTWKRVGLLGKTKRSSKVMRLRNGSTYRFRVRALHNKVAGAWFETDPVTPRTVPGQARGVRVLPDSGSLTVKWLAPAWNGGAAVTEYRVQSSANGRTWSAPVTVAGDVREVTLTGLTNGVRRYVRIIAVNSAGASRAKVSTKVAPKAPPVSFP